MKPQRKIDDHILLEKHAAGMSQEALGEYFQCSQQAIQKRLKRLAPPPPSKLDDLTPQQANFAKAVASGKSATAAALETYDCTTRDSAKQIGKRLMACDDIRASIDELMNDCGLTRGYRVRKLKSHVDHPDAGLSLKALDLAFKVSGDFAPIQVEVTQDWQLRALLATIDLTEERQPTQPD